MSKIRFGNGLYDSIICDGNIELQGLNETIIFDGGGKELTEDAEKAFFSVRYAGQRLSSFIAEYIEDTLQYWVDVHKEDAQIITHFIN